VTLADRFLPRYDVVMRHHRRVAVAPGEAWAAIHRADLGRPALIRTLLALRGLRAPWSARPLTLASLPRAGFIPLAEEPGRELALGLVGRFWTLSGGRIAVAPEAFREFAQPGYAKAVWTLGIEAETRGTTRLATETRVVCTDAASRRRFRRYWRVVGPFAALIRNAMLGAVAREAVRGRV
jgi:hypothetical protein